MRKIDLPFGVEIFIPTYLAIFVYGFCLEICRSFPEIVFMNCKFSRRKILSLLLLNLQKRISKKENGQSRKVKF